MRNRLVILIIAFCTIGIISTAVAAENWSINAAYIETCSCNPTCPCLFGSPPTLGRCEGNNLIEIKEGHYGDVRLDGVSVVTAFSLGDWMKIYVDENTTDEQTKALLDLLKLKQTFGSIYSGGTKVLSVEKVPISIDKTPKNIKFSVPDSRAEIKLMEGKDGKPIKILNLPVSYINDHTQYKAVITSHKSKDKKFKYSGTNGLTSNINVTSKN